MTQRKPRNRPRETASQAGPGTGPGRTSDLDLEAITDQAEHLMLYGVARHAMARALAKFLEDRRAKSEGRLPVDPPPPFPVSTVDDYIRRVKDRWEANPLPDQVDSRRQQIRRLKAQVVSLAAAGKHSEVEKRERLLARLEGNEAPVVTEWTGPGGAPLAPIAPAESKVEVHVYVPDAGRRFEVKKG